jgi:hypothetical protein
MPIGSKGFGLVALLVTASLAGCAPGPFTRAAGNYAGANLETTAALAKAPQTAYGICRKRAQLAYLQVRLGVSSTPEPIPWNTWYTSAKATDKQAWREYCASIRSSGVLFGIAVGALRQYGVALKTLAGGGAYDGSDLQGIATNAAGIAVLLEAPGPAAAAQPVGTLAGRFATFLYQDVAEDKIEDYVRRADPLVQALAAGAQRYVAAVEDELDLVENVQRQTLLALEVRADLVEPPVDPGKLLEFYGFARATEDDIDATRAILDGYRRVAERLGRAHSAMVRVAARGEEIEVKQALGAVFDLLFQLRSLNTALAKE